jgi:hypothetical protein
MVLALAVWLVTDVSGSIAQDAKGFEKFSWQKDESTGVEIAASRSNQSVNFFDIGDFSPFSFVVVQKDLAKISEVAGETIDRTLASSIAVFRDSNVFSRLRNDKRSFASLGIPDWVIDKLSNSITDDNPKCFTMSLTDAQNNIYLTVILLSQQSNDCLHDGLLESFGVRASAIETENLVNVCMLYEGRRLGFRDRQSLSRESSKLRDKCLTKVGGQNGR